MYNAACTSSKRNIRLCVTSVKHNKAGWTLHLVILVIGDDEPLMSMKIATAAATQLWAESSPFCFLFFYLVNSRSDGIDRAAAFKTDSSAPIWGSIAVANVWSVSVHIQIRRAGIVAHIVSSKSCTIRHAWKTQWERNSERDRKGKYVN